MYHFCSISLHTCLCCVLFWHSSLFVVQFVCSMQHHVGLTKLHRIIHELRPPQLTSACAQCLSTTRRSYDLKQSLCRNHCVETRNM
ncbi:hypothetical protein BJV77DRAFT_331061 [Russula vinacea]|nr:hypothetical protein BJV77DRAFT_331061 [Russula vinacea]